MFHDLITNALGVQIALNTVNKLFNPEELKGFLRTGWFFNENVWQALNSENGQELWNFFLESAGYEKPQLEDLFEKAGIQERPEDIGSHSEYFLISKTFNALGAFFKTTEFKECNSAQFFKCAVKNLHQISANQSQDYLLQFWNFVQNIFDKNKQKNLMLFQEKSKNALMAVTMNENKSSLKYIFEIVDSLFEPSDI